MDNLKNSALATVVSFHKSSLSAVYNKWNPAGTHAVLVQPNKLSQTQVDKLNPFELRKSEVLLVIL